MGVYGRLVSACADIASSGAGYRVGIMLSLVLIALGIRDYDRGSRCAVRGPSSCVVAPIQMAGEHQWMNRRGGSGIPEGPHQPHARTSRSPTYKFYSALVYPAACSWLELNPGVEYQMLVKRTIVQARCFAKILTDGAQHNSSIELPLVLQKKHRVYLEGLSDFPDPN